MSPESSSAIERAQAQTEVRSMGAGLAEMLVSGVGMTAGTPVGSRAAKGDFAFLERGKATFASSASQSTGGETQGFAMTDFCDS